MVVELHLLHEAGEKLILETCRLSKVVETVDISFEYYALQKQTYRCIVYATHSTQIIVALTQRF